MKGYINSYETAGMVDGPGIRFVVFMQGCDLRCLYCHNPETWIKQKTKQITPEELVEKIKKYKNYFKDKGGVTFSGGEPLLQPDFLIQTMILCHKEGINTCLDTAGYGTDKDEEVLKHTDLVILDIKSSDKERYKYITSKPIDKSLKFLDKCQKQNKKMWLRQVIVPGINDNKEAIQKLKEFIKPLKNIEKVELLPYHTYAKEKYKKLNIKYRLENTPPMDQTKLKELEKILK